MTAVEDPGETSTQPASTITRTLAGVGKVVAPTALLTAVLYYFGWARTEAAADRAGTDQSLFGYSTSDYVLRSVGALYRPIGIGLLLAATLLVIAGAAKQIISDGVSQRRITQRAVTIAMVALVMVGISALAIGAPGLEDVQRQHPAHLSATLLIVGATLLWAALGLSSLSTSTPGDALRSQRAVLLGVVVALFLVGIFAVVLRLAFEDGAGSINALIERLPEEPEVVVTSSQPLDIQLPGVRFERILAVQSDGTGVSTRFRYAGLHLLIEANDRLFLVTKGFGKTDGSSAVAVVPATSDLRIDFLYGVREQG